MSKEHLIHNQYKNSSNLNARIKLHELFSTNKQGFHEWAFDQLKLENGFNVLECGCGPAALWYKNHIRLPPNIRVELIDLSNGMLADASKKLNDDRFHYTQADIQEEIPFEDHIFDIVIANHMLYHLNTDREKGLREMKRVLKPGGRFHASTFGLSHLKEIDEIIRKFVEMPHHRTSDSFTLENGMEQIEKVFPNTTLLRHQDFLVIGEAQPLLDYILSSSKVRNRMNNEKLVSMTDFINNKIKEDGKIVVTKDAGTFISYNLNSGGLYGYDRK